MRAWSLAVLLLASLASGCVGLRPDDADFPSRAAFLAPGLEIEGAAENFLGCVDPAAAAGFPDPGLCHEVLLRVSVPSGSGEWPTAGGWSGTTTAGGVYAGRLTVGPEAIVGGALARLRIVYDIDDGARLATVTWTDGNVSVSAPVPEYTDTAALAPRLTLLRAERAMTCMDWRCTEVTVDVDNSQREEAFPPAEMRWVVRSVWGGGDAGITAEGQVPARTSGPLVLRAPYLDQVDVGFVLDGWTTRAFTLPDWSDLPVRDDGERLEVLNVGAVGGPQRSNGSTVMPIMLTPTTFNGDCTPFAGTLDFTLDWQPGPYIIDALWQERRTWSVATVPDDFDDEGAWCSLLLEMPEDRPVSSDGSYRVRVVATPGATGEPVAAETVYTM